MEQRTRVIEELGSSRLMSAAWQGQALTVRMRLGLGEVDVNARDRAGRTPLHMAAMRGHREMAEVLLSNGALVNACDGDGWTPLRWLWPAGCGKSASYCASTARTERAAHNMRHGLGESRGRVCFATSLVGEAGFECARGAQAHSPRPPGGGRPRPAHPN